MHTGYTKGQAAAGGKVHIINNWESNGEPRSAAVCGADMAQSRTSARGIRRGYITVTDAPVTCAKCAKWLERTGATIN